MTSNKKNVFLIIFIFSHLMLCAQTQLNSKLAKQYLDGGNYEKAIDLYKNLYNNYKSANYYQALMTCYIEQKDINEGEKLAKQFLKRNTTNVSAMIDLGHIYTIDSQEKKGEKIFTEVFSLIESNEKLVSSSATRFSKYQYFDLAIQAYEVGLRNPNKSSYRYQIARIYDQLNNLQAMFENYIELVMVNKAYLKNVKIFLTRTISLDAENENNQLLKKSLLIKLQASNNENVADLLIWLLIQEKKFSAALEQEKSLDKRFNLNQKKIFDLASICRKNKAFDIALDCYKYIVDMGVESPYYIESQIAILNVKNELLVDSSEANYDAWALLETEYIKGIDYLGKTSFSVLLLKDLAHLQAFRLHQVDKASSTILEALGINSASAEDLARCKLVFADILLLKNEIWDAILNYSQVDKSFKHDLLGHEAKFRRAKISYYQGDFDWAQAQLDVLKKSTSKLIANNAMELSLLIQDNLNLDTTAVTMNIFSRADLLIYQNKLDQAHNSLDSIIIYYPGHSLIDEALYRQFEIKIMQNKKDDAAEILDQVVQFYSFDILADDAKFQLAQLQEYYFKNIDRASELYQDIIKNHQDSFFLSESRKRYRKLRGEEL